MAVGAILMLLLRAVIAPLYVQLTDVLSYLAALGATIVITEKLLGLRDGLVRALAATGGVLTSAGIILAGTFLILLSRPVKDLAAISIGVALGVLIDTFLMRTALVPGLTLWVGPGAGWPGPRWARETAALQRAGNPQGAASSWRPFDEGLSDN